MNSWLDSMKNLSSTYDVLCHIILCNAMLLFKVLFECIIGLGTVDSYCAMNAMLPGQAASCDMIEHNTICHTTQHSIP